MAKRGGRSGRKYVRDSIGRFATTGATARGGRLKTAGGKKRATQTVKAKTGSKPAGALKAKPKSEGQRYAGRVQAGKDLKRSQSVASQKKFLAKTQKRLDAAPLAQSRAARATGKPAAAKRKKTDLQRMQQADRIMGKLAKRQKAVVDKAPSLNEGLKQVRRNNARAGRVNQSLASKGLLAKYTRLTAPADPIRMTPAGKGIPKSRKAKPAAAKPTARSKPTVARTSKAPANKAKAAYKRASGDARMRNADLRGADAKERRMANSASAKVKNMQRRRSTSAPKAGAEAPRSKQKAREFARIQRAYGNERRAYAARGDGPGTAKQSRSASVAKRARDIYSGKISASKKTTARLTRTQNPDVLKARIKKGEKLTAARAKKKSVTANSERAAAKRRGAVGKISEAKAGRIVARMDAQRGRKALPGRRNANFARTYERSRQFILKPSTAALKKGKPISVNESVQKAVANAAKRRKPKPAAAKPAVAKVTRTGGRINAGRKADRKATLSVNKARSEERAARFDATNKNKMAPFSSPKRQKQNERLNNASNEVDARIQTRRNIRAQFPVNRKTPLLKAGKISSTIKKASATKAQKGRATANKERSLFIRGNVRSRKKRKTSRTSMKAAEFYSNPVKALKGINKGVGYKAPRSLRKGVKQTPVKPAAAETKLKRSEQMSQKEKWAARAEKRRTQATKAEANAKRLRDANRKVGDNAFWTQPGLGKQRDKARAGLDKSFKELERAKKLRLRADNLERMSKRNKGDAASRQQLRRDKFDSRKISKGQTVNSTLYGPVKVLRVNKKTVTISLNGGKPFTEDKSRFREAL